jgi:L-cystine transport system permease protein
MGEFFSWDRFFLDIPKLLPYLPVTLKIVLYATLAGSCLGLLIALLRIWRVRKVQFLLRVYISFMRGTPILVQMLVVFYGLPLLLQQFGIQASRWDKIFFVYIAYALNEGAFLSEIFRSSILAIPYGQVEAGLAVGMTRWQTFRQIILPQASRVALPSFGANLIGLFQNTSLAFLIGVVDIMGRAKTIGVSSKHAIEAYLFIGLLFIVISVLLKGSFYLLDKRFSYGK